MPAPVALFVHSRLDHSRQTIEALQFNLLASQTPLYIFSDGARANKNGEAESVDQVRQYVSNLSGFLSVTVVERNRNWGLKRNIVEGLNYVLERHPNVIVVEDDCVSTPDFLCYMNKCLSKYESDVSVWHISGWGPFINLPGISYRSNFMSCWGWATWRERWQRLDLEASRLMSKMDYADRYRFNINGSYPFFSHLVGNFLGKNNTWAIFWAATIFTNGGVCVGPVRSKVRNIGMDNSGTHKAVYFDQNPESVTDEGIMKEEGSLPMANQIIGAALRKSLNWIQKLSMHIKMLTPMWVYRSIRVFRSGRHD